MVDGNEGSENDQLWQKQQTRLTATEMTGKVNLEKRQDSSTIKGNEQVARFFKLNKCQFGEAYRDFIKPK